MFEFLSVCLISYKIDMNFVLLRNPYMQKPLLSSFPGLEKDLRGS